MTNSEEIEELKLILYQFQSSLEEATSKYAEDWQKESLKDNRRSVNCLNSAIKSLEENEQLKAEIERLRKKEVAKKPIEDKEVTLRYVMHCYICPQCGGKFQGKGVAKYCYHCGQKIDWSER